MEAPAIGLGIYALLIAIELYILKKYRKQEIPWREIVCNVNAGHILLWASRVVVYGGYFFVSTHWSLNLVSTWSYWVLWIFAFVAWDFSFYWSHRLHHKISWLWKVHVVHHQGEHFSLSLGVRNSWFQSITSLPFFLWLAILGVPFEIYGTVAAIHITVQFYNHNQLVGKQGFLERFMSTPTHHRIHHGTNPQYVNKNHGGTFIIWDKLFGTFAEAQPNVPIIYGVDPGFESFNPATANLIPFTSLKPKIDQDNLNKSKYPVYFTILSGLFLYAVFMVYIGYEQHWSTAENIFLIYLLFAGTVFIGGFSNGNGRMLALWVIHMTILPMFFLFQVQEVSLLLTISMLLLSVTGFLGLWIGYRRQPIAELK